MCNFDVGKQGQIAQDLLKRRRFEEAIAAFQVIIARRPNDAHARAQVAVCLFNLGKKKEAGREISRALAANPNYAHAHWVDSLIKTLTTGTRAAELAAREAVRLEPDQPQYLATLARTLTKRRCYEEASAILDRALQINPEHIRSLQAKEHLLRYTGNTSEAEALSRFSLALDPENTIGYYERTYVLLDLGDREGALKSAREMLRLHPDSVVGRLTLLVAMRCRNPIYHLGYLADAFLRRFPRWVDLTVAILLFAPSLLSPVAAQVFGLRSAVALPISILAFLLFLLLAGRIPIANGLLVFTYEGRTAMSQPQRILSWTFDMFLTSSVVLLVVAATTGEKALYPFCAITGLLVIATGAIQVVDSQTVAYRRTAIMIFLALPILIAAVIVLSRSH